MQNNNIEFEDLISIKTTFKIAPVQTSILIIIWMALVSGLLFYAFK